MHVGVVGIIHLWPIRQQFLFIAVLNKIPLWALGDLVSNWKYNNFRRKASSFSSLSIRNNNIWQNTLFPQLLAFLSPSVWIVV